MDRIDAMRAFVTAVDRGSLASAARTLGHSPATMTRALSLLEGKLGMRLLHRSTRALRLTQFGESYYATCREVLSALDMAERGAAAEQEQASGLLTITAPLRFGQLFVRPVVDAFLEANPAVRARLVLQTTAFRRPRSCRQSSAGTTPASNAAFCPTTKRRGSIFRCMNTG
jgi:DNA-binding transcriptional LysR family regulator